MTRAESPPLPPDPLPYAKIPPRLQHPTHLLSFQSAHLPTHPHQLTPGRTLLFDLPLPLVQDVIRQAVHVSESLGDVLSLRLVNRISFASLLSPFQAQIRRRLILLGVFECEATRSLARNRLRLISRCKHDSLPEAMRIRLLREHIGDGPHARCTDFVKHVHAVVDDLHGNLIPSFLLRDADSTDKLSGTRLEVLDLVCTALLRIGYLNRLLGGDYRFLEAKRKSRLTSHKHQREDPNWRPESARHYKKNFHRKATKDDVRRSSIMVAIIMQWPVLLEPLLKDPAFKEERFRYRYFGQPLETAIELGYVFIVRFLLARKVTVANRWICYAATKKAAVREDISTLTTLLDNNFEPLHTPGVHVDMWDQMAEVSAQHNRWAIVRLLLDHGHGQPHYRDRKMNWAAHHNRLDFAKEFIEKGARTAVERYYSDGPLLYAVRKGHIDMVKLLLEKGAREEVRSGCIDAYKAIRGPSVEVMELLVKEGMKIGRKDLKGCEARKDCPEMVEWLRKRKGWRSLIPWTQ